MRGKVRRVTASLCSKTAGREARPATPEAGVLPNFWEWSACGQGLPRGLGRPAGRPYRSLGFQPSAPPRTFPGVMAAASAFVNCFAQSTRCFGLPPEPALLNSA